MIRRQTEYHRLSVVDVGDVRSLEFDGRRQSAIHLDDGFTSDIRYTDYLHLAFAAVPQARRVLAIGLGGGAFPKRVWHDYRQVERIDCVEIDPAIVEIARRFFALPEDGRLRTHICDGREFVERSAERWDIAALDAYFADSIPYHLGTLEFLRALDERLAPGGAVVSNVIGAVEGNRGRMLRAMYKTMHRVWENVFAFPVDLAIMDDPRRVRNVVLLATHAQLSPTRLAQTIAARVGGLVTVPRFARFADDLYTKRVRTFDVPLLCDDTTPPDGLLHLV